MATATNFNSKVQTVRRVRRAYLGLHGVAFDFALKRAKLRVEQVKAIGQVLVGHGETIEADAADKFSTARDKFGNIIPRKTSVKADVKLKSKPKAKPASKVKMTTERTVKAAPKKVAPKKAVAPVVAAPKVAAKVAPKVEAPKAPVQAEAVATDKYAPFVDAARSYDAGVNPAHIKSIVNHLGVALQSRDGKFVACSDEAERETVAKSWLTKKLGVEGDTEALDDKVMAVCETMKNDRFKNRVTFYYLIAKNEGKLDLL